VNYIKRYAAQASLVAVSNNLIGLPVWNRGNGLAFSHRWRSAGLQQGTPISERVCVGLRMSTVNPG
jgi:hypothetical protein